MQVRAIEFQESFARVPVEQARQQHVLMREPDLARDQTARIAAQQNLLDLTRPVALTETENVIVDPEGNPTPEHRFDRRRHREHAGQTPRDAAETRTGDSGAHIDLIA